jgi:hypothetical protein
MHTHEKEGVRFHYNSDLSGNVEIEAGNDLVAFPARILLSFVDEVREKPKTIEERLAEIERRLDLLTDDE